jgi:hypothetical protein
MKYIKIFILSFLLVLLSSCTLITSPTFQLELRKGIDTININETWLDSGIMTWVNQKEANIDYSIVFNDLDTSQVGTYTIIYESTYRNITKQITRKVTVIDLIPPQITLNPGIDTVYKNSEWIDAYVTVIDNSGLEVTITTHGTVNTNMVGEYMIIYRAVDFFGNESSVVRYVHVIPRPNET